MTNTDKIVQESAMKNYCKICDYVCSRKFLYDRHVLTRKHEKRAQMLTIIDFPTETKVENVQIKYTCECGKNYNHRQSLFVHKKKCQGNPEKMAEGKDELLMQLIKENQEFKQMIIEQNALVLEQNKKNNELMLELAQKPTTITNNCTNKNRFNINLFLNEKCKDAMNITDFVDSLKLTLGDLEKTGEMGYVKGITNIIVKGLNELDVYKRPIHCSDTKRETLYIKDNDGWEKEKEDKKKITRAIKHISLRNAKQINDWTKENKGYNVSTNKKSDTYLKLIMEANGGEEDEINKIITNVSTHIAIDKEIA
jgi:hypothetical protein